MKNHWTGWTVAAVALAMSASAAFACDRHAEAANAQKDAAAVATKGDAAGCNMPCCAHAKAAADEKIAAEAPLDKPCAGHDPKGCPKKSAATAGAVAKAEPGKDTAKPEPATDPGTNR